MKILNTEQIREADQYTIRQEPVASIDLMERAAKALVQQLEKDFPDKSIPKYIICGSGNNGGDGLAIARLLLNRSHKVNVFIFPSEKTAPDHRQNLVRLQAKHKRIIHVIEEESFAEQIPKAAMIIDAVFGTGLNEPIHQDTLYYSVIEKINYLQFQYVVSVDIPSGLFADKPTTGIAIAAHKTYAFQFPKLAFMFPENGIYVDDFTILDIGLHPDYISEVNTSYHYITQKDIQQKLVPRKKFSHKGTYGHALIVAGSYGKTGAAILCSMACLRAGAGLVTAHIPSGSNKILQAAIPEVMSQPDKNKEFISEISTDEKYTVAIGPGIGTNELTIHAMETFLKNYSKPVVIDADGLNILSAKKKLLILLTPNTILTPHPKEFERLAGKWKNDFARLELQRNFSKKHNVIIVLKGAHTSITDPEGNVYFNSTGNPGMATGGSGDVLTGIITGLLAQGNSPLNSALIGVYIHGAAGDFALDTQSMESLIASDITAKLGKAFKQITCNPVPIKI